MADNMNQGNKQAIVVSQTTVNPNQATEEIALFDETGAPFEAGRSWYNGHGQIYVSTPAVTAISDTVTPVEAAGVWTLTDSAHLWDETAGNGRLTFTGDDDMTCHIAASVSFTVAGSNDVVHLYIGVNGTIDPASEVQRKVGTGSDVGSTALHLIVDVTNGDYLSLFVLNATAADDVTLETGNLQVVSMP